MVSSDVLKFSISVSNKQCNHISLNRFSVHTAAGRMTAYVGIAGILTLISASTLIAPVVYYMSMLRDTANHVLKTSPAADFVDRQVSPVL